MRIEPGEVLKFNRPKQFEKQVLWTPRQQDSISPARARRKMERSGRTPSIDGNIWVGMADLDRL